MNISEQTKQIYTEIAGEFDRSRIRIWPCVKKFLDSFPSGSVMLDVGCGNGKNMMVRPELKFEGIDFCPELVQICINKGLNVTEASMTSIPYSSNYFDGLIAIASYHHLSNDIERKMALDEIYRVIKSGGKALIVVWAMEQPADSTFHFTQSDSIVKWKSTINNKIYDRYYHIYKDGDLFNEIVRLKPEFNIKLIDWEKGNWYIVLEK